MKVPNIIKKRGKSSSTSSSSSSQGNSSDSPMDVSLLERIVKLMTANDLNTVDVRDGDKRVILKRGANFVAPNASSGVVYAHTAPAQPQTSSSASAGGTASGANASDEEANLVPIKSPMVGTFYASP